MAQKLGQLHPDDLPGMGFHKADELSHEELTTFLIQYVRRKGLFIWIWIGATALHVFLLAAFAAYHIMNGRAELDTLASAVLPALLLLLPLIPLHEWLHGLAYKWAGAKTVSYIINWKKLYVAALADRFVIGRKPFYVVALAPFVVISALLTAILVAVNPFWQLCLLITLLLHTLSCMGDFAMINYMQLRTERHVVTYDDNEKGKSYFWVRD